MLSRSHLTAWALMLLFAAGCRSTPPILGPIGTHTGLPNVRESAGDPKQLLAKEPATLGDGHSRYELGVLYATNAFGDAPAWTGDTLTCDSTAALRFRAAYAPPARPLFLVRTGDGFPTFDVPTEVLPGAPNALGIEGPLQIVELRREGAANDPFEVSAVIVHDRTAKIPFDPSRVVRTLRDDYLAFVRAQEPAIAALFETEARRFFDGLTTGSPRGKGQREALPLEPTKGPACTVWLPRLDTLQSGRRLAVSFVTLRTQRLEESIDDGCAEWRRQGHACDPIPIQPRARVVTVELGAEFALDVDGSVETITRVPPRVQPAAQ